MSPFPTPKTTKITVKTEAFKPFYGSRQWKWPNFASDSISSPCLCLLSQSVNCLFGAPEVPGDPVRFLTGLEWYNLDTLFYIFSMVEVILIV